MSKVFDSTFVHNLTYVRLRQIVCQFTQDKNMSHDATHLHPVRTSAYLSRYECTRVLGLRVLQLQDGNGVADPLATAIHEIVEKKHPAVIRRHLPNDTYEDVAVCNLKIDRLLLRYQLSQPGAPHAHAPSPPGTGCLASSSRSV